MNIPAYRGILVTDDISRVVQATDGVSPRTDRSDVKLEVLLVWCRGQRKRMVLVPSSLQTRNTDPLSGLVVESWRFLHFQVGHLYVPYNITTPDVTRGNFNSQRTHKKFVHKCIPCSIIGPYRFYNFYITVFARNFSYRDNVFSD